MRVSLSLTTALVRHLSVLTMFAAIRQKLSGLLVLRQKDSERARTLFDTLYNVVTGGEQEHLYHEQVQQQQQQQLNDIIALIQHESLGVRYHLFSHTAQQCSIMQLALRDPTNVLLTFILDEKTKDPSLPLDVNLPIQFTYTHPITKTISTWLESPLWIAVKLMMATAVALLLHHGADVNLYTETSPLFVCMETELYLAYHWDADSEHVVDMLLHHGAKVDCRNAKGVTLLMLAARNFPRLVGVLLQHLPDVEKYVCEEDGDGRTALHYVMGGKHVITYAQADMNSVADTVELLCSHGTSVWATDHEGHNALMSCCTWLPDSFVQWNTCHVWFRISRLMVHFHVPVARQWRAWELVGAEIALIAASVEVDYSYWDDERQVDFVYYWEQALLLRQQLSSDDIPPIPALPAYVEPITAQSVRNLRNDWISALTHALQVRRRHLGDDSLAVTRALDVMANYIQHDDFVGVHGAQAFKYRTYALTFMPSASDIMRLPEANISQKSFKEKWLHYVAKHLDAALNYVTDRYLRGGDYSLPLPDSEWSDLLTVMKTTVDMISLSDDPQYLHSLNNFVFIVTCALGDLSKVRMAEVQCVFNMLTRAHTGDVTLKQKIFRLLLQRAISTEFFNADDDEIEDEDEEIVPCFDFYRLGIPLIVRAARTRGISLDPQTHGQCQGEGSGQCQVQSQGNRFPGPIQVCASLLADARMTDQRKTVLRVIMKALVEEGGAHWDAAVDTGDRSAIRHYDVALVARYISLQCLAASVVSARVNNYDLYLPACLADFVRLH